MLDSVPNTASITLTTSDLKEIINQAIVSALTNKQTPSERQQIPAPEKFDGNSSNYIAWKIAIREKLNLEGTIIGNDQSQFNYIYNNLDRKVQLQLAVYVENQAAKNSYKPSEFITYLDTLFLDPNRKEKALSKLHRLQQERLPFSQYHTKFEHCLAEGGGLNWPDEIKISYLRNSLNLSLKGAISNQLNMSKEYVPWVNQVAQLSNQQDAYSLVSPSQNHTSRNPPSFDKMDWEPTKSVYINNSQAWKEANNQLKGKRAKWISNAEFQQRKLDRVCLRCGRKGCHTRVCPLLPAIRPTAQVNSVMSGDKSLEQTVQALVGAASVDEDNDSTEISTVMQLKD